jgi:HSP20 family molecular chaperone IbpA
MNEPLIDIIDLGDTLLVEVALPGVLETDIDVTLLGQLLVVHAERPAVRGTLLLDELARGLLVREIPLPTAVELAGAVFEEGLLRLTLKRLAGGA